MHSGAGVDTRRRSGGHNDESALRKIPERNFAIGAVAPSPPRLVLPVPCLDVVAAAPDAGGSTDLLRGQLWQ